MIRNNVGSINDSTESKDDIRLPLIKKPKPEAQPKPFTLRTATKNIWELSGPFTLSHLFNLGGPIVQGGYMGNGNQLQREAFGLIETFINSILTSFNASQIVLQMFVSSNDGFANEIEKKLKKEMIDLGVSFKQQQASSEEKSLNLLETLLSKAETSLKTVLERTERSENSFSTKESLLARLLTNDNDKSVTTDADRMTGFIDALRKHHGKIIEEELKAFYKGKKSGKDTDISTLNDFQSTLCKEHQDTIKRELVNNTQLSDHLKKFITETLEKHYTEITKNNKSYGQMTLLNEYHEEIIREAYAHVGLNMRAGMVYAQTLLIPIIPLFLSLKSILVKAGVESEVAQETADFFRIFAIGSPAMVGMLTNREIFNALHHQWLALGLSGFNMLSNITLGGALFYGWGDLPKQGTAGIATAFSTSAWLTFLSGGAIFLSHPVFRKFQFLSNAGGNFKKKLRETFREGIKVFGMALPDYLLLTVVMVLVSRYSAKFDVSADVAQGAFSAYNLVWYAFILGNTDATINRINRAQEEKSAHKLLQYARANGLIHASLGLLSAGLFWGIPKPLFNAFCLVKECSSEEVDQFTDIAFYGAFAVIADALVIGSKGILAGLGNITPSMIISIVSLMMVGISLQLGVGATQDVSPGELNLLRFLAIAPSLIAHLINLGYTTDKKIHEITERGENVSADEHKPDDIPDSKTESTSCLGKVSQVANGSLRGWANLFHLNQRAETELEIEEVVEAQEGEYLSMETTVVNS